MKPTSICRITDADLVQIIRSATKRLFFLSAGCSIEVAEAIIEKWQAIGTKKVNIILDVDAEVCRLGYGELGALQILETKAREFVTTINHQKGIRIGMLVADETILIFSPTPLLIEAGSGDANQPNAIKLERLPESILNEIGLGAQGVVKQTIGLEKVPGDKIQEIGEELAIDPPLKFDIARTMHAFNAHFEFVELNLKNCSIRRKKISLPNDLILLTDNENIQNRLNNTFDLISKDSELSDEKIARQKNDIIKNFVVSLKGYGSIVLRSNKALFEEQVNTLEKNVKQYQIAIEKGLEREINKTKQDLMNALLPRVKNNPPPRWRNRIGVSASEREIRSMLENDLDNAIGTAKQYIQKMSVHKVFKGVTYELLNDEKFVAVANKAIPSLSELYQKITIATGS